MSLSETRLKQVLDVPFQYFDSVASSNDLASAWLRDGAKAGSLIIADEQREGRGRNGRVWYTPPYVALAVSAIYKPPVELASRMTMVGALAITNMAREAGAQDIGIKWPNDVQIAGKKVSGILSEAIWDGDKLLGVVLGMGVNVRVDFSEDIALIATNLEDKVQKPLDRAILIASLAKHLKHWMNQLEFETLWQTWRDNLVTLNQRVIVNEIEGIAENVLSDGTLLIRNDKGHISKIVAGDVMLVSSQNKGD